MDIKKQDKMLKATEPTWKDLFVLFGTLLLACLGKDLSFETFMGCSFMLFLMQFVWLLCWCVQLIVVGIVRHNKIKKGTYIPKDEKFFENEGVDDEK